MAKSIPVDQKKRLGRPPTGRGKLASTRLMPPLLAALDAWAETAGVTRSTAIRQIIEQALAAQPKAKRGK